MGIHKGSFLVRSFLKYAVIFGEGTRGESAYLLKEGRVEISKMIDGRKKVLAILKPISMFGEMAILLGDSTRTATAVALEDIKVVEISKHDFEDYIEKSPAMISTLLQVLVHRLKTSTVKALHVPNLFMGVCNILGLYARHGMDTLNYLDTLQHLSMAMNTSRDSIENTLKVLEDDAIIKSKMNDQQQRVIHILETKDLAAKAAAKRKASLED